MIKVVVYLLAMSILFLAILLLTVFRQLPNFIYPFEVQIISVLFAGFGSVVACFKGVNRHYCLLKDWDEKWEVWYYLRPLSGLIMGGVAFLLLKAGLLVLDSTSASNPNEFGYYAIAFVAGYNVDNFIKKIEEIAKTIFGIDKTPPLDNPSGNPTNTGNDQ